MTKEEYLANAVQVDWVHLIDMNYVVSTREVELECFELLTPNKEDMEVTTLSFSATSLLQLIDILNLDFDSAALTRFVTDVGHFDITVNRGYPVQKRAGEVWVRAYRDYLEIIEVHSGLACSYDYKGAYYIQRKAVDFDSK